MNRLSQDEVNRLVGWRQGTHDCACPLCAPEKSPAGAQRKVLRVFIERPDFATYVCVRCGAQGYVKEGGGPRIEYDRVAEAHAKTERHQRKIDAAIIRTMVARQLWSRSLPAHGSVVETYLRDARKLDLDPIPSTIRFLRPSEAYRHPTMIVAFGLPDEPEPGVYHLPLDRVQAVHLSYLAPDGSGRADIPPPKTRVIGPAIGHPLALLPPGDGLALFIGEGIESSLSGYLKGGFGVWAAGSAGFMPALAAAVPDYIESVTVGIDNVPAGRRHGLALMDALAACRT